MQGHETVMTFLFSDIEGSTRLWEGHADEMSAALKHHDELLAAAVEENDGRVFKHTGDGICAVFAEPVAAIEAAVSAQRYFSAASWLTPHPLRIRIGIHSGKAFERGDDFFGPSLNRVARLTDAAHGGQILVSHDAAAIGRAELPSRYELVSLGQHRLRDLGPPSPVYQVGVDGQSTAFPPLRTLEAVPNNLPSQLASFVGRNDELQQVRLLLGETRLLTLTGVGGVGKTRLALHAAAAVTNDHDDGVWLVELAAVTDPQDLPDHVAAALGIRETPNVAVAEAVMEHLADKAVLLILDNCEHVIDAAAKFADHHLRGCPDLQILATSREALGVGGETLWRVPSLGLPGAGARQTDAIQLFIERASLVQPGFDPSGEELDLAEQICRRLDGIPLAIELAAARLGVLPLDQIATRLDDRFRLLTGGSRTALPRQRTLAATMDWSHDLLGTMERVLLRRLSVFHGGFTLDAAEQVCTETDLSVMDILDVLSHLVDTSLVVPGDERQRYSLLETVRQYSADKLLAKEESDQVRRDHCAYYLTLAGKGDRLVVPGEAQAEWLDLMEVDHDNVRAALAWAADSGERSLALRIAGSAALFWWQRGHHREARRWLGQVLDMGGHEPSGDLARAQSWGSSFALEVGDMSAAESLVSLASESAAALQEPDALARASMRRSNLAWGRGDSSEGVAAMRQAADVLRAGGGQGLEVPLANLALLSVMSGDRSTAVEAAQELRSLPEAPGFGDMFVRIVAGMSAFFDGDLNGAEKELVLALEDVRDLDVPPIEMSLEIVLAWTLVLDDRPEEAERLAFLASEIAENLEAVWAKADVATVLGMVALARAEYVEARRLLDAGLRVAWQAGFVDPTVYFMHAELLWREGAYRRAAEVLGVGRSAEASVSREVPSPHVVRVATVADALEGQLGEHDFAMALARGEAMTAEAGFRHTLMSPPEPS